MTASPVWLWDELLERCVSRSLWLMALPTPAPRLAMPKARTSTFVFFMPISIVQAGNAYFSETRFRRLSPHIVLIVRDAHVTGQDCLPDRHRTPIVPNLGLASLYESAHSGPAPVQATFRTPESRTYIDSGLRGGRKSSCAYGPLIRQLPWQSCRLCC